MPDLLFCAKYPFTKEAKELLREVKLDEAGVLLEKAVERVNDAFTYSASRPVERLKLLSNAGDKVLFESVVSFALAKLLVGVSDNRLAVKKFAEAESSDVYYFLQTGSEEELLEVSRSLFPVESKDGFFLVRFQDYANNVPFGDEFKLVNVMLSKGFVFLDKFKLAKLVKSAFYNQLAGFSVQKSELPESIIKTAEELFKKRASAVDLFEELGPVEATAFPPCIKRIISRLKSGEKVDHTSRFVLATFFASINMPLERAVDFFRDQPNFNEKKTRYYLEHAYGEKTGTKYRVPSCSKIQSYGLCYNDETCLWKNPLTYYKRRKSEKVKK